MYNPFSLEGKTILITGASSGIGRATAIECSKLGANVILSGRNEEHLADTKNSLLCLNGQKHKSIIADLTDEIQINNLVECVDCIDGLVNNAGVNRVKPINFIKMEDLDYIFHSNTFSSVSLTKLLVKKKKIKNGGSIVFTSSLSGVFCVHYGESMYAASKGAVSGFAKGAALDLAAQGIRVNCVNPSIIQTNIFKTSGVITEEQLQEKAHYYYLYYVLLKLIMME